MSDWVVSPIGIDLGSICKFNQLRFLVIFLNLLEKDFLFQKVMFSINEWRLNMSIYEV